MTTFQIGDRILANATAQGMKRGTEYEVVDLDQQCTPFGTFVTYKIRGASAELWVGNLHLLASREGR